MARSPVWGGGPRAFLRFTWLRFACLHSTWQNAGMTRRTRFPVETRQLPLLHCEVCRRPMAYTPGSAADVLTAHYRRSHSEMLGRAE